MPADVQIRCISLTTKGKARRRGGILAGEGKSFRRLRCRFVFSSKRKKAEGIAAFLRALPADSNKEFRLGPGKRWQQHKERGPCSCCARPLSSRFGIYYKRENPLQITTSLLGSVWNGRERTKWIYNPSREWSYVNSRLMENNFHVRFREHFFR